MAFSLWPQAAAHKPQVSTSQLSHPGPEGGRTAPCSDFRMERALVACSISSREFDALQTFLIWILWGNQPKQQCSMVVPNQRPKWSCTELQWSLLPASYFHCETRPGDCCSWSAVLGQWGWSVLHQARLQVQLWSHQPPLSHSYLQTSRCQNLCSWMTPLWRHCHALKMFYWHHYIPVFVNLAVLGIL